MALSNFGYFQTTLTHGGGRLAIRKATKKTSGKPATRKKAQPKATPAESAEPSSAFWELTIGDVFKWTGSRAVGVVLPIVMAGLLVSLGVMVGVAWASGNDRPEPNPGPNPPSPSVFEGLAEAALESALECKSPDRQGDARAIAGSLDRVVNDIQGGTHSTLNAAMRAGQSACSSAMPPANKSHWHPWSSNINALLTRYHTAGQLVTAKDAGTAFTEIARGLSMSAEQ